MPTETPDDQTPGPDSIYVQRQFDSEIIVLCVRWYITYRLRYRDLVAMMVEQRDHFSHDDHAMRDSMGSSLELVPTSAKVLQTF